MRLGATVRGLHEQLAYGSIGARFPVFEELYLIPNESQQALKEKLLNYDTYPVSTSIQ